MRHFISHYRELRVAKRRVRVGISGAGALALVLTSACAPITPSVPPLRSFGVWVTYWDFSNGMRDATGATPRLEDVFVFGANLAADGTPVLPVKMTIDSATLAPLRAQQRRVWLTVVNDVVSGEGGAASTAKDPGVVTAIVATRDARERHVAQVVELARRIGFDGIDIDYENIRASDRAAFAELIRQFADAAHAQGLQVSVTVQPKLRETVSDGPGGADWRALCAHADRVQVMLYNEHSGKTGPGPISSSPWIRNILAFAQTECPRDKIVPALKVSGAEWGGPGVRGIQHDEAVALALANGKTIQRDSMDGTPYFSYERERVNYTVYFEDAESIRSKSITVRQVGFDRVTLWSVGRQDPALFGVLTEAGND